MLFEPLDYDDPSGGSGLGTSPLGIGVDRGRVNPPDVRIYRDVYYTSPWRSARDVRLASIPPTSSGQTNSSSWVTTARLQRLAILARRVRWCQANCCSESRFWSTSGTGGAFRVFGSSPYWVPDPREIRYIR